MDYYTAIKKEYADCVSKHSLNQIANILGLQDVCSLSQLPDTAIVAHKQPQTVCCCILVKL